MEELPTLPFDNPSVLGVAPRMRTLQQEGADHPGAGGR